MPPRELRAAASTCPPAQPRTYGADEKTDNRSAWGPALVDLAEANPRAPIAVFDCDLRRR